LGTVAVFKTLLMKFEPNVVFHLVGRTAGPPEALYHANCVLAANLMEAAQEIKPKPVIVLIGSAAEYGPVDELKLPVMETHACEPITPYGISKYAQTLMGLAASKAGVPVIVARVFNLVGRGMPTHLALGSFAEQLRTKAVNRLHVGNLDVERDFIDVAEAARLIIGLASSPKRYETIYNICSGRPIRLRALVETLVDLTERDIDIVADAGRLRANDILSFYGSTARLEAAGLRPSSPDFSRLLPLLLTDPGRSS
jgi:GDP-4-dehydro-6-deoxy-D-mannose reductase